MDVSARRSRGEIPNVFVVHQSRHLFASSDRAVKGPSSAGQERKLSTQAAPPCNPCGGVELARVVHSLLGRESRVR
jgi:hypothetical protein